MVKIFDVCAIDEKIGSDEMAHGSVGAPKPPRCCPARHTPRGWEKPNRSE